MKILAIETSCDETAIAIVECDRAVPLSSSAQAEDPETLDSPAKRGNDNVFFKILAETVASQIKIHRPFGGVVPALAKREHIKNLPILFNEIKNKFEIRNSKFEIDRLAVTIGPGLEPALWTGINFANDLAKKMNVPIVGINHLEGHIFSNWLPTSLSSSAKAEDLVRLDSRFRGNDTIKNDTIKNKIKFPSIVLLVSGGHTILLKMDGLKKWSPSRKASADQWTKLGETRDDAVGEAFDKVAKMLGLPYPGGPEIENLAQTYAEQTQINAEKNTREMRGHADGLIQFPRPMINSKNYDFSFSGLKTAVLYYLKDTNKIPRKSASGPRESAEAARIAASFQQAAIDVLVKKTMRAAKEFEAKSILLGGGVACNKALIERFKFEIQSASWRTKLKIQFYVPPVKFNTDNAVMIAAAACLGNHYPADRALPNLNL